jgi:cytochrome P450
VNEIRMCARISRSGDGISRPGAVRVTVSEIMTTEDAEHLAAHLVSPTPPSDPWSIYRRLNEISPITRTGEVFVATGYAEVSEVIKSQRFGQGPPENNRIRQDPRFATSRLLRAMATSAVMADPPAHTRLRRVLNKIFTVQAIKDIAPHVASIVDGLIGEIADRDQVDLKAEFAAKIPMNVIGRLVGFPEEDRERLFAWGHVIEYASTPFVTDDELLRADQAATELAEYADELFRARSASPRDDMLTQLVEATAADGMTTDEFTSQLLALMVAGTQTTVHMITSGLVALHESPDELARLRRDPTLDATMVDEILRYYPPLHTTFPRIALEAGLRVGQVEVPQGTKVFPFVAAANRDPSVFRDPDRLILDRDTTNPPHLTFAHGIHLCVGRALARLEGRIAIRALIDRFPRLQLDPAEAQPWATAMARGHACVPATLNG